MFGKTNKTAEDTSQVPEAIALPDLSYEVMSPDSRVAARDFGSLKAVVEWGQAARTKAPLAASAPTPIPKAIETKPVVVTPPKTKVPHSATRTLILSGLLLVLALSSVAGVLLYSNKKQAGNLATTTKPSPVVTTPIVATPTPVVTVPVETPVVTEPTQTKPDSGKDTDSDGLTDSEERLFGTDVRVPDTDSDTYLDGNEVFHGFDPTVKSPATLALSRVVSLYTNDTAPKFSFLTPDAWAIQTQELAMAGSTSALKLATVSGSEFRITTAKLAEGQNLATWYDASSFAKTYGSNSQLLRTVTKKGYAGLISQDQLFTIVTDGRQLVALEYDLKRERTIDYLQTFQMIINSFTFLP